ncbi:hypothetical protein B0H19DRAFT_1195828 [Mycena capillaripes]|nr:hypothetical protein B0H19DRAFT_1195828 [Mycena capillaripes]
MLAASRCSTQACLVMISLSIRRLNSDHRDSAFRGFDVYVGATTVTLLNIGNRGIPKNTCQFWGLISSSVWGALFFCRFSSPLSTLVFFIFFTFLIFLIFSVQVSFALRLCILISLCLRSLFALDLGHVFHVVCVVHLWFASPRCKMCGGANHRNTTHTTSGEIVISL